MASFLRRQFENQAGGDTVHGSSLPPHQTYLPIQKQNDWLRQRSTLKINFQRELKFQPRRSIPSHSTQSDEMPAARCCSLVFSIVTTVVVFCFLVSWGRCEATAARGSDANDFFRLDFSPFATLDLPSHVIHPNNRGGSGNKRQAASVKRQQPEERRDPCYSVVVRLGEEK